MAPMLKVPGGNMVPVNNNDVQMQSEVITISLYPGYYMVEVNYIFKNHGKQQKVAMGFPSSTDGYALTTKDFKAYEGDVKLNTYKAKGTWDFKINSKNYFLNEPQTGIDVFECVNVDFAEGEVKSIKNTYRASYAFCQPTNPELQINALIFHYILKTGSLWKDSIDSIRIVLNTDNVDDFLVKEKMYFQDNKMTFGNIDTTFVNIDPDFDFSFIVIKAKAIGADYSSSTLAQQGNYTFDVSNLSDKDNKTAWVEGVSGYGIGETIVFSSNQTQHMAIYNITIDSIGIITGYTYDEQSFEENSRVKKIEICHIANDDHTSQYIESESIIIDLKDTTEMQYFVFEKPLITSGFFVKIIEVYKGSKYADTAISEIKFFVKQE